MSILHGSRPGTGIVVLVALVCICIAPASAAIGSIIGFGDNTSGQTAPPIGAPFTYIAAFGDTSLAMKSDGSLAGWGKNDSGQAVPPAGTDYVAIAQGNTHGLALRSNGSIAGWGDNSLGQQDFSGTDYTAVIAGDLYSYGLKTDGSIVLAGFGGTGGENYPPGGTGFTNVSAGYQHNVALRSDGSIACWGTDTVCVDNPPPAGTGFVAIDAAQTTWGLALHSNGSIYAYGTDIDGRLDAPQDSGYVAISAGANHGLALHSNGSVIAWGRDAEGQATVPAGNNYQAVAAGGSHSLLIMGGNIIPAFEADPLTGSVPLTVIFTDQTPDSPTAWNWDFGDSNSTNATQQHPVHTYLSSGTYTVSLTATNANGPNTTTIEDYITVTPPPPVANFSASPRYGTVPLEVRFTDTSTNTPTAWLWQFGDGSTSTEENPRHTYSTAGIYTVNLTVSNKLGGSGISRKNYIRVFADPPGAIAGWGGYNGHGEASPPAGSEYIAVDGGHYHSIALRANGSLVAWGENALGQTNVPPGDDYIAIAAGRYHNYALCANGSVVGWGDDSDSAVTGIPHETDFTTITAGDAWGAALRENGTIVEWGDYTYGLSPPPSKEGHTALDGCFKQALAVSSAGRIIDWGENTEAGLYLPPIGNDYTDVAQGEFHGLGLMNNGSISMWGDDNSSQLHIPPGTYTAVAAGRDFSLALGSDGTIAQSGAVLGENWSPPAGDRYTSIAAGEFHALAIGNIALAPDFTANETVGVSPLAVQFTDMTTGGSPTSWLWDFGDGDDTDATLQNPVHTYTDPGDYTVSLTVSNTMGSNSTLKLAYITVLSITEPPVANFTATPTDGTVPLGVSFNDSSLNYPTSWSWDFGDGGSSTEQDPYHTYTTAGHFNVALTATNDYGSNTTVRTAYIEAITIPEANFTANITSGMAPLAVQFNDTSLYEPTFWLWDFGDGETSVAQDPVHTYNAEGMFNVSLRAWNGAGANTTNRTNYISVAEHVIIPEANFTANRTAAMAPAYIQFTDSSTNTPTSWSWDFGDGGSSTEQNPVHLYTIAGVFNVTLNATNAAGTDSMIKPFYITIAAAPVADFTGTPRSGPAPLTVQFNDLSINGPSYWLWDFGDGDSTNNTHQNPVHTYLEPGVYTVSLYAQNTQGSNTSARTGYILVNGIPKIGVFTAGTWALDKDGSYGWNAGDAAYTFGGAGDNPVIGDWNRDGLEEVGTFNGGTWYLDYNGNGVYDGSVIDRVYTFGSAGFRPVTGDWNGDGTDEIGVQLNGIWAVDYNGNGGWDGDGIDRFAAFGQSGDLPVIGDWDGDGADEIGSHLDGFWAIDYNGNYAWDGITDDRFAGLGMASDKPVIGDWNGDGADEIGMETDGFWAVDYDGDYIWDGIGEDRFAGLGQAGDTPVVADFDGNRKTEICSFTDGFWAVDYNGNYAWDGVIDDRFAGFGGAGTTPVVGAWS